MQSTQNQDSPAVSSCDESAASSAAPSAQLRQLRSGRLLSLLMAPQADWKSIPHSLVLLILSFLQQECGGGYNVTMAQELWQVIGYFQNDSDRTPQLIFPTLLLRVGYLDEKEWISGESPLGFVLRRTRVLLLKGSLDEHSILQDCKFIKFVKLLRSMYARDRLPQLKYIELAEVYSDNVVDSEALTRSFGLKLALLVRYIDIHYWDGQYDGEVSSDRVMIPVTGMANLLSPFRNVSHVWFESGWTQFLAQHPSPQNIRTINVGQEVQYLPKVMSLLNSCINLRMATFRIQTYSEGVSRAQTALDGLYQFLEQQKSITDLELRFWTGSGVQFDPKWLSCARLPPNLRQFTLTLVHCTPQNLQNYEFQDLEHTLNSIGRYPQLESFIISLRLGEPEFESFSRFAAQLAGIRAVQLSLETKITIDKSIDDNDMLNIIGMLNSRGQLRSLKLYLETDRAKQHFFSSFFTRLLGPTTGAETDHSSNMEKLEMIVLVIEEEPNMDNLSFGLEELDFVLRQCPHLRRLSLEDFIFISQHLHDLILKYGQQFGSFVVRPNSFKLGL